MICLVLGLATLALYWPVHSYEFVNYDDWDYVAKNPHIHSGFTREAIVWAFTDFTGGRTLWHPLTWLSHMLDCQLFGVQAGPHHLVNVCFHALNAILLFLLLRSMTGALWRSAIVAALFAWHPLEVDTVAWIAERKNLLSTCLLLLLLMGYNRYVRNPSLPRYLLVFLLLCLGLMAKPPFLVMVPCLLLVLDFWPLKRWRIGDCGWGIQDKGNIRHSARSHTQPATRTQHFNPPPAA